MTPWEEVAKPRMKVYCVLEFDYDYFELKAVYSNKDDAQKHADDLEKEHPRLSSKVQEMEVL
jgi:hypothetical protein